MTTKTSKTKLSIFSVAGIVAIAAITSGFMLDDYNSQSLSENDVITIEPTTVSKPYEYTYWTGVPILEATPASLDREKYHQVNSDDYSWLQRVLDNGVSIVDKKDLEEFYTLSDGNYYFKADGNMYTIHYTTAKVNLENNYVRAIPLDNPSKNSRNVETALTAKGLEDIYNWVQISDAEADEFFNLKVNGNEFKTSEGNIQLQYIGKLSPESSSLDYKAIVDRSTDKFIGEHDE